MLHRGLLAFGVVAVLFILGIASQGTPGLKPTQVSADEGEIVDVEAEVLIFTMAMPNPPPVDPNRCLGIAILQWDHVDGANSYEFSLTDTRDFWEDLSPFKVHKSEITDEPLVFAWFSRETPDGKHQMFLSSGSTGQGCDAAQAGFEGRFTVVFAEALVGGPIAAFIFKISDSDPLVLEVDASSSKGVLLEYEWVWGDGTSGGTERFDPTSTNTYEEPGTYAVTLTVTDADRNTDDVTHTVVIADGGVLMGFVRVRAGDESEGLSINYSGTETGFTETDQNGAYSVRLKVGSYTVTGPLGYCYEANLSECQNAVPVAVTRNGDEVTVEPPQVDFGPPDHPPVAVIKYTRDVNDPFTIHFDASDSNDIDNDIESYEWNFGDGEGATGAVSPSHTYADAAKRTVRLTVTDATGNEDVDEIEIMPGAFVVSGQLYEQVCGRPSTRAPFQQMERVDVQAHTVDGFLNTRPNQNGYSLEATPGEFSVFPDPVDVIHGNTPPFPAWDPAIRFFDLEDDTPNQDFALCYDAGSPAMIDVTVRNAQFSSQQLSMRNGGVVRFCDQDGFERELSATGTAGGDLVYTFGYDAREVISGCSLVRVLNPAASPMHVDFLSSGTFGPMDIILVVLPGTPVEGITETTQATSAGSNRLEVASNAGFQPGDTVAIDEGGDNSVRAVVGALGSLILTEPLAHGYPAGTIVLNVTRPASGVVFEKPATPEDPDDPDSGTSPDSGTQDPTAGQFPVLGGTPVAAAPAPTPAVPSENEVAGVRQISPPSTGSAGLKDGRTAPITALALASIGGVGVMAWFGLRRQA